MERSKYKAKGQATVVAVRTNILINFAEPLIEALKPVMLIKLLSYFRPVDVIRDGEFPVTSCMVLLSVGIVCWLGGMIVFCRKDIPTA